MNSFTIVRSYRKLKKLPLPNIIMRNDNFSEKAMKVNGYLSYYILKRIFFDRSHQNNSLKKLKKFRH